ncbi:hypothetical protein NEHOM01_0061 [Nematocida homosporus]|uniref:uncharacterized protein n=1 Tax=Nematocida homosporus TaxID=1912981 RepID=UPI00222110F6|nr:uncharacterized protein NEHOM01_0061 [Nematocida homosporus]KAI5184316.1 hypothetical protein NEHOM01_0061 [Nematocida homosporus]
MDESIEYSKRAKTEEIYSVGYCKETGMAIAGGGDDAITLYKFVNDHYEISEVIEGLDDSVVFVAFLAKDLAVAVTMDGSVVYIELNLAVSKPTSELQICDLQIDVSYVHLDAAMDYLYVGTSDGLVERVPARADPHITRDQNKVYPGHRSDILYISTEQQTLYTGSHTQVLLYHCETAQIIARYESREQAEITVMRVVGQGKVVALGFSNGTLLLLALSNDGSLTEIYRREQAESQNSIEALASTATSLLYGGFAKSLNVLDMRYKAMKETMLSNEEYMCVVKIIPVTDFIVVVVGSTGTIYITDIREAGRIIKEVPTGQTVFDAALHGQYLCVATATGAEFIDLSK